MECHEMEKNEIIWMKTHVCPNGNRRLVPRDRKRQFQFVISLPFAFPPHFRPIRNHISMSSNRQLRLKHSRCRRHVTLSFRNRLNSKKGNRKRQKNHLIMYFRVVWPQKSSCAFSMTTAVTKIVTTWH